MVRVTTAAPAGGTNTYVLNVDDPKLVTENDVFAIYTIPGGDLVAAFPAKVVLSLIVDPQQVAQAQAA